MAVWSELPDNLLGLVFHHLSYPDHIRSRAVCKSWLIALKSMDMPIKTHSPMLLLDGGDEIVDDEISEFRTLFSLEEKKSYRLHLPQIRGCRILASGDRWLVTIDDAAELHLFNPFTLVKHALPSITTLPVIQDVKRDSITGCITGFLSEDQPLYFRGIEYMRVGFYRRALIFHQSSSSEIVVFIICGDHRYLAFARVGEECWTGVEKIPPYSCFSDVILHKGHYYGVTSQGSFVAFDIFSTSLPPKVIYEGPGELTNTLLWHYLAESSDGDSLMHIRRHDTRFPLQGVYNTRSFTVFLLDMIKNEMIKVERLEQGTALLLGRNRSMMLRTQDVPELRENCIYFADGMRHHRWLVAFFDMTTGIVEPLYPFESILNLRTRSPPAWLSPLCQY